MDNDIKTLLEEISRYLTAFDVNVGTDATPPRAIGLLRQSRQAIGDLFTQTTNQRIELFTLKKVTKANVAMEYWAK